MMDSREKKTFKGSYKRLLLIVVFIMLVILSLMIGASTQVTFSNLFKGDKDAWFIFVQSRIPRTIAIVLTSSAVSVAGLIMQTINRNKFISPQTAGTTDAAALGILIAFLLVRTQTKGIQFVFAFAFSLAFTGLFIYIIQKIKFKNIVYVPLIGLMYGSLIASFTTVVAQSFGLQQILGTLNLGSFTGVTLSNFKLIFWVIPPLIISIIYATKFSIVALGEDLAKNLGVRYERVMIIGLIVVSLISASTFIVVGPLPFIGLIIPNIVSLFYGDNFKKNIIDMALFGSIFVMVNDIISRILIPNGEVAISFTMGITGAVIFLYLIFRRVKHA